MARPRKSDENKERDARRARDAIVQAAGDVVAEHGAVGLTVAHVLPVAGVSRRTFYRYFDSKEALLAALFEATTERLVDVMRGAMTSGGAGLDALRAGLDAYYDHHAEAGPLLRVLTEEAIRADSRLAPLRDRFNEQVAALIDAAVQARHGRRLDPLVFTALLGATEAVSLALLRGSASAEAIARAKATTHGLLEAILEAPGVGRLPERNAVQR